MDIYEYACIHVYICVCIYIHRYSMYTCKYTYVLVYIALAWGDRERTEPRIKRLGILILVCLQFCRRHESDHVFDYH